MTKERPKVGTSLSGLDDQVVLLDKNGRKMKARTLRLAFYEGRVVPRRTLRGEPVADQCVQPIGFYTDPKPGKKSEFVALAGDEPICFLITEVAFDFMELALQRIADAE